jgi:hypothetical protein
MPLSMLFLQPLLWSGGNGRSKRIPFAGRAIETHSRFPVAELSRIRQDECMKIRSWLHRISAHLLGVVDEYWAMREPAQYHQQLPCCDLKDDLDAARSSGRR